MRIVLTAEQCAILAPQMIAGRVLLGRVLPEPFDGTNAETSGRLSIELGTVKESALPSIAAGNPPGACHAGPDAEKGA